MRIIKTSKIHANSKVEWDTVSGPKEGKVKQIMGTHACIMDSSGLFHVVHINALRKKSNVI